MFFLCCLSVTPLIGEDPSAGQSIAVQGKVSAEKEGEKTPRTLQRGSAFFSKDVVNVGPDSKAQLKFIDGGLVTIIANSKYRILSYTFTKEKSEVSLEIVEGGFRAMTGTIGKEHPTDYKVKTPVATIGIRGTIFELAIINGELQLHCVSGSVVITSGAAAVSGGGAGGAGGTGTSEGAGGGGNTVVIPAGSYVPVSANGTIGKVTTTPLLGLQTLISAGAFTQPPGGVNDVQAQATIQIQSVTPPEGGTTTELLIINIPESEGNPSCGASL